MPQMKDFRMPSLGADMEGGTLVEWLKSPGDTIHRGDIIAVVETVKGAIEIECFDEGVLSDLVASPGAEVAVGEVIAHIAGDGESAPQPAVAAPPTPTPLATPPPSPAATSDILL